MTDIRETRKKEFGLAFGGYAVGVAIWVLILPSLLQWMDINFVGLTATLATATAVLIYRFVILGVGHKPWQIRLAVGLTSLLLGVTIVDGFLRYAYRFEDCLRIEQEIVTAQVGKKSDPATAFQALRCMPSGGIITRVAGFNKNDEQKIREEEGVTTPLPQSGS